MRSYTDRTREVLKLAESEARRSQLQLLPEHILLGLLLASRGVGQYALEHLQVDLVGLKQSIEKRLLGKLPADIVTQIVDGGASRIVLWKGEREARRFGHRYIGTEHLLLGILSEGKSGAVEVLHEHGIDLHAARLAITEILGTVRSGN